MDARQTLALIRRRLWLLGACVVLSAGSAFLVSQSLPKTYSATVTLIVGQSLQAVSPDINGLLASQRLSQTYTELVSTGPLLSRVIAREGLDLTPEGLRRLVTAHAALNSTLVTITATSADAAKAASVANTIADELIAASPGISGRISEIQQFLDRDLVAAQTQIEETQAEVQRLVGLANRSSAEDAQLEVLQGRLVSLRQTYATLLGFSSSSGSSLLTVVDPAVAALEPSSPRVLLNAMLAAIVGLILALGLIFLREYLDDTLKSPDDVEASTGLPTLGTIIRMKGDKGRKAMYRLVAMLYPLSPEAEAYRTLRTNIEFASVDKPARTILVTSAIPGEGKTTTAANLAVVFAQTGHATLLVDADLRRAHVHKMLGLHNDTGLTNLIRSDDVQLPDVIQATEQEHLSVLTSGPHPPNPAELLRSSRMRTILERLVGSYEFVIIDSPPLQAVTDAAIVSSIVDGTVLVVDAGSTRRGAVQNGHAAVVKGGGRILGVTLNRLSEAMSNEYYSYDYRGGYGNRHATKGVRTVKDGAANAPTPGQV
jgi:capsular exopolysaccharide synthesis family protein